jgi:hypothetical protein
MLLSEHPDNRFSRRIHPRITPLMLGPTLKCFSKTAKLHRHGEILLLRRAEADKQIFGRF